MKDLVYIKRTISMLKRNDKFKTLSLKHQKWVISAIESGRVYLSNKTNGTPAVAGCHYTTKHFGKMSGVVSISTSVILNKVCAHRRQNKESICSACFAASDLKQYKNLNACMARNLDILSSRLLEENEIPIILSPSGLLRGESFGDASNIIHAANILNICRFNSWCRAAIYTKNPNFYALAIARGMAKKGNNTNLVFSSYYKNVVSVVPSRFASLFDRVFTVYTPECIKRNGVVINCGARSCATCRRCYSDNKALYFVREKIK